MDFVVEFEDCDVDSRVLTPDCKGWSRYSSKICVEDRFIHELGHHQTSLYWDKDKDKDRAPAPPLTPRCWPG